MNFTSGWEAFCVCVCHANTAQPSELRPAHSSITANAKNVVRLFALLVVGDVVLSESSEH